MKAGTVVQLAVWLLIFAFLVDKHHAKAGTDLGRD